MKPITSRSLRAVSGLFSSRSGQWVDSEELQAIGGQNSWRTRVSECRTVLKMSIANRLRRREDGSIQSQYMATA